MTPRNKDRLYIGLYARSAKPKMPGKEDTYHWALLTGPNSPHPHTSGHKYHARERLTPAATWEWEYESRPVSMGAVDLIVARIAIAKVVDLEQLVRVFDATPLRPERDGWNCIGWAREAVERAWEDGGCLGTKVEGWDRVREAVMGYAEEKRAQRRWADWDRFDQTKVATWDAMVGREVVP